MNWRDLFFLDRQSRSGVVLGRVTIAFALLFIGAFWLRTFGSDVIDAVRLQNGMPYALLAGEDYGLWVPISWKDYFGHLLRPVIFAPFLVIGLGALIWHHRETDRARAAK